MTFELMLRFVLGLTLAFGPAITFTDEESAARAMVRERQAEMVAGDIGALRFRDPLQAGGKRGFCQSCGARRMAESARHLVEDVFGPRPVRQWVLSVPVPLRFLFASKPEAIGPVLGIVHRVILGWLADQAGVDRASAECGTVTLIQRFGSALNLDASTQGARSRRCRRSPPITDRPKAMPARSAVSRCMRASPPKRTRARS